MKAKTAKVPRKPRPTLKPPRLRKLGTLAKITRGQTGSMADGGSGMTRP